MGRTKLTDKQKKKIIADYMENGNYRETGRINNVSDNTVRNIVNKDQNTSEKLAQKKEEKKEEKTFQTELIEKTEQAIKTVAEQGLNNNNIDFLYKAVDIHKDLCNENYWKVKEDYYMYGNYDEMSYGRRGVRGTGRGRYRDGMSYGRRGVPGTGRGRYRGQELIEDMMEEYGNYSEGKEMYGADQDTLKSFKYMLKAFKDYYKHLKEEASSQEEIQLLEQTAREMLEM